MRALLTRLWNPLRAALGWAFPVFAKARGAGTALRWVIHALVVAAQLVGLYLLSEHLGLAKYIPRDLRKFWLPILGLLLYALCWLAVALWRLWAGDQPESHFPDIDAAWDEAVRALGQADIGLTDAPLFLVLGRPEGSEDALFQAAQMPLAVRRAPPDPKAPLHVYANADGIYVTCVGASLLGRQAAILTGEFDTDPDRLSAGAAAPAADADGPAADIFTTMQAGKDGTLPAFERDPTGEIAAILREAQKEGRRLTGREKRRLRILSGQPVTQLFKGPSGSAEMELLAARFEHLCRLIARDRRPYCPANGILVLVPFAALDNDEDAFQTADLCHRELDAARRVLRVLCPRVVLVCDLENAPGFREFVERFPAEQRRRRIGQRFPLDPVLRGETAAGMVESGVRWICGTVLPNRIYEHLRLEAPDRDAEAARRGNARLFYLLSELRARQRRLGALLGRGLAAEADSPPLLAGCYLAGTGADAVLEQSFAAGVLFRLYDRQEGLQNYVSWTDAAWADEAWFERGTRLGYLLFAALALAALAVVGYLLFLFPKAR
jgi:hypothetical protein